MFRPKQAIILKYSNMPKLANQKNTSICQNGLKWPNSFKQAYLILSYNTFWDLLPDPQEDIDQYDHLPIWAHIYYYVTMYCHTLKKVFTID